ncbi:putative G-protein coupled receptor 133 [Stylophora pistillata]|uniref:Putative G-protein coupled receptor 133 n=1 Tax=Stylophora pistillata TaxID=50429 RepID=A0A2B4RAW2_STYPI|nr:putative G-protein coupled receptor 133 [Stylophora pistillata]
MLAVLVKIKCWRVRLNTQMNKALMRNPDDNDHPADNRFPTIPSTRDWMPPKSSFPEVELFLNNVKKDILEPKNLRKAKDNLMREERSALGKLKASDNVFRIQDKGSRLVIISQNEYQDKMLRQLNNDIHYTKLSQDPTIDHFDKVKIWGQKWFSEGQISQEIATWVANLEPKPGVAFGNAEPIRFAKTCLALPEVLFTWPCARNAIYNTDMRGPLSQIRVSLVASLGAGQIIFLAGIGATKNKGGCVTVAALVQYLLMAAFCWMFIEGIYLYLFVVKVYNVGNNLKICHGVSWGLPALIVAISLSIAAGKDGIESFVSEKYCWMSPANGLIWIFIVFVVLVEFFNILILGRVIKEMTTMQQEKDKHSTQIRLGVKACVVMIPLLGISWLFGLLSPLHKAFAYIFTIFNSTQIRARLTRRIQTIFPAMDDGTSTKRISVAPSDVNEEATAIAALRKVNVQSLKDGEKTKTVSNKTSM